MNASKTLLLSCILAVARPRPLIHTVGTLGEIRALFSFDFVLFLSSFLMQAAGRFLAFRVGCVLDSHDFLHGGRIAALINEVVMCNVPAIAGSERRSRPVRKAARP